MPELSIIEFIVYAVIGYAGVLGVITSAFRDIPSQKDQSVGRVIWLIPSAICILVLGSAVDSVSLEDSTNTIIDLNTTNVWTESIDNTVQFIDPVWIVIHGMFFMILVIYIITNAINLFVKT